MGLVNADHFDVQGPNGPVTVRNAQWIYWVGPFVASLIIGTLYRVVPPGYMAITIAERAQQSKAELQR